MYCLMICCLRNLYPLCFPFRYNQSRFSACSILSVLDSIRFQQFILYLISCFVDIHSLIKSYFYPPCSISFPPISSKRATMPFLILFASLPFRGGSGWGLYILSGTSIPSNAIPFLMTLATFLAITRRVIFSASVSALSML